MHTNHSPTRDFRYDPRTSILQHWMEQLCGHHYATFNQSFLGHGVHILTFITSVNQWLADRELSMLAVVWVEGRNVTILYGLYAFLYFLVEAQVLCSSPVQCISSL
jgi:hypothetical protein